jgi:hypothetical protein
MLMNQLTPLLSLDARIAPFVRAPGKYLLTMRVSRKMIDDLKIGVLIPDRGDRPDFLFHCWYMLKKQTRLPDVIELVNDAPLSEAVDITYRYRVGYERLQNAGVDIILFIENDDWYSPQYIETMVRQWILHGKPDLFGTIYTIYFNVRVWKYCTMWHQDRASAMNTLIKPGLKINWPVDSEPYTDAHLWMRHPELTRIVWHPGKKPFSIGIKGGTNGMTGGAMHTTKMEFYETEMASDNIAFLQSVIDPISFKFYESVHKQLKS